MIADAAIDGLSSINILVNNAGGNRPFRRDASAQHWLEARTLNFIRHRQLAHRLLRQMIERQWGRIVNITGKSEHDRVNGSFAKKVATHACAKGLAQKVGKSRITVNCIPPGQIMSE